MKNIITIKDLTFQYNTKEIFNKLNLNIAQGKITSIIGPNGSGKSTIIKILLGFLPYEGNILIDDLELKKENIFEIRKNIGIVFENPDNQFIAETVMDDIAFTLENMNYDRNIIKYKITEITKYIGIFDILEKNPHSLSGGQKQLVSLASALVHEPKILIFDESFSMIDPYLKEQFQKILLDLKNKGMTIIVITHDMEETIISDNIILLNEGQIIFNENKEKLYEQEELLQKYGFTLPFMVDLSNKLKFYGLINETIYDMEEMVDTLWQ